MRQPQEAPRDGAVGGWIAGLALLAGVAALGFAAGWLACAPALT